MKVIEFITKLEQLGFNDETELSFGFLNGAQGEVLTIMTEKSDVMI